MTQATYLHIRMNTDLLRDLDAWCNEHEFPVTRSDAVRAAIRQLIGKPAKNQAPQASPLHHDPAHPSS